MSSRFAVERLARRRWPGYGARERRLPGLTTPQRVGLATLVAAAIALRAWAMAAYSPAVLTRQVHDAANYIFAARTGLIHGQQEPLGYPIFLRILHVVSHQLAFTIGAQHLLGLVTGALLFLTVRRLGPNAWLALGAAAVPWLGGDHLFLEQAPLSEALFTVLIAATLYAATRSLDGQALWLILTGVLAGALLAVRSVALPLPLLMIGWVALASWRTGLPVRRSVALVTAAVLLSTVGYAAIREQATGTWSVAAAGSGWNLYGRAAEFADCRRFTPPEGTASLCDRTSQSRRQGPGYYLYLGGPAHHAFGEPAAHDGQVRAFAGAAIIHQPLDFLALAGTDFVRYAVPSFGRRRLGDFVGPIGVAFPIGRPALDPQTREEVAAYYGPVSSPTDNAGDRLHAYQSVMRISGPMLLVLIVIALAGIPLAEVPRRRWGLILALGITLELLLVPTISHAEWRYAVPAEGPAAVAATTAATALTQRRRAQRRPTRSTLTQSRAGV